MENADNILRVQSHQINFRRAAADPLEPLAHPLRALRQHLEGVLRRCRHHAEDGGDLLVRQLLVKEVRHRVDEDAARLLPPERDREALGDEANLPVPARVTINHAEQVAIDRLRALGAVDHRRRVLCVAVEAARADARTADRRVPGLVRPLDAGSHRTLVTWQPATSRPPSAHRMVKRMRVIAGPSCRRSTAIHPRWPSAWRHRARPS